MSASRELSPDWVLSSFIHSSGNSCDQMMELADAASAFGPASKPMHARSNREKALMRRSPWRRRSGRECCGLWRKPFSGPMESVHRLRAWTLIFSVSSTTVSTEL